MHKEEIIKWKAYCSQPSVIGQLSSEALKQQQKVATYLVKKDYFIVEILGSKRNANSQA